jgi:hypothetical protein
MRSGSAGKSSWRRHERRRTKRSRSSRSLPPSAVTARQFVGREYVFNAIKQFIDENSSGYFVIEADPGAGKSALLAEFARREDAIAHYNVRSLAINTSRDFLATVCAQLIERFALPHSTIPDSATKSGAILLQLLGEAAGHLVEGQKLVVVVDALDEVETSGHPEGANILFLPPTLPDCVFFVKTRRHVELQFKTSSPYELCKLSAFSEDTRHDIVTYIQRALKDGALRKWVESHDLGEDEFVATMADKSENNFMYLRHVLPALTHGAYEGSAIEELPQGLQQYYQEHWHRLGMTAKPVPVAKIRVVYILSEVRHPASRALISQFASTSDAKADELAVQEILDDWREFLHETKGDASHYSVYHASFRDFLHRKDIVQAAGVTLPEIHSLIADDLWERHSKMTNLTQRLESLDAERRRYTLETLAGHLDDAGQHERLHALFADPEWMSARVMMLTKLRLLRVNAARGFLAIRAAPGFSEDEREEAAALLSVALEPSALTVGVPKHHLAAGTRLLDADTVERVAPSLSAIQARTLIEAVLDSRARVKRYKGNQGRARALAALASRVPTAEHEPVYREAINELIRLYESVEENSDRKRTKWKPTRKARSRSMKVTAPDGRQRETVVVYFDDRAAYDEGMDLDFSSYVEDLSDLEIHYAGFGAALEALANIIPEALMVRLFGLAVFPFHDYGWVCVRAICALEHRFTGELREIRSGILQHALETLARLPEELQSEHWWRLAPILDNAQLAQALGEHHAVHDETQQARTFTALAPHLTVDRWRTAVAEARERVLEALADNSYEGAARWPTHKQSIRFSAERCMGRMCPASWRWRPPIKASYTKALSARAN